MLTEDQRIAAAYSQPALLTADEVQGTDRRMDGDTPELTHARYKSAPPIAGYNVLLTKAVRHMTPEKAREVAADLLALADYAEAVRDARVALKSS